MTSLFGRFVDDGLCGTTHGRRHRLRPHSALGSGLLWRTIEVGIFRQEKVGGVVGQPLRVHEIPVLDAVVRYAELHSLVTYGLGQFTDDITLRPHLFGVPFRQLAVVHGKSVVMLCRGNDVAGTSLAEQFRPGLRVELLCLEHRDEVLVAKLALLAPPLLMVAAHGVVHVLGIPLAARSRYAVDSPVDEDAELGIHEPFRRSVVLLQ